MECSQDSPQSTELLVDAGRLKSHGLCVLFPKHHVLWNNESSMVDGDARKMLNRHDSRAHDASRAMLEDPWTTQVAPRGHSNTE